VQSKNRKKREVKRQSTICPFDLSDLSDEELVVFIREKDKNAYCSIIDRYHNKIWFYINRLINNPSETDDLVQQTLVNAYTNLYYFDEKKKFSSWIYRIAHNLAVNYLKKKKAKLFIDEDDNIGERLFSDDNVLSTIFTKEENNKVNDLLNNLPEKYKAPLVLRFGEEKSYEEISEILRIPKNTVGTFINRAKKILKNDLDKFYGREN